MLVDGTKVGLPHPFDELLSRDFCLLQADWGFPLGTAQV